PYAEKIAADLRQLMIRAEVDLSNDSFSKKVRNSITKKIPNTWIVGANEVRDNTITWRRYSVEKQEQISADKAKNTLVQMVEGRFMDNFGDIGLPL
ncbi:MAG TPA: His/Gly/Thr/Pro-type tRNA ligase C-terminal domain-containing protein, partial [bacterium]|nr:His/Gly/Thr/Pro-type tRNA ligase C-terminal domain-containing protein [bacterium]